MRKMPVLTMVGLAVLGLVAMPVHAATTAANDTPDLVMAPGGTVSLDLADFFASADALTYSADGATVAGSVAEVFGAAAPGTSTATFSAGDASVESTVQVSSFIIGNGPKVDDNNRIAGMDGGNVFYNALVPGGTINSMAALTNLPAAGGGGTPGGGTGAAGLASTVASIDMTVSDTGLVQVSRMLVEDSGLTATLNADGSYSVAASAGFSGAYLVTLGASDGTSADAVHLLAAEAMAIDVNSFALAIPAGTMAQAPVANGLVQAAAGQGTLVVGEAIEVGAGASVTLVADYNTSANANIALVLFDGGLGANLAHCNPSGANIQVGTTKSLSMSIVSQTGTVVPAFQVAAPNNAANVQISNMALVKAGPVTSYGLNPNAKAYSSDLADISSFGFDILGSGASGPAADGDNNFAAAAAGSMKLAGAGGVANAHVAVALEQGTAVAECYAKTVAGEGTFALVLTDGAATSCETFAAVGSDWSKVIGVATLGAPTTAFLVVQAAGADVLVDDLSVRVVDDNDAYADLSLLGM